jgi:nucleoside-diphosphate-sugar epimerase
MVDAILAETGSGSKEYVSYPENYVVSNFGDYIANYDKIRKDTGWKPRVKLAEGVKEMVAYYKKYRSFY